MCKAMLLVLCAVLLVAGSVMGTLAYLQAQTGPIKNTMTVGNVAITLDEAPVDVYGKVVTGDRITATVGAEKGNSYKLIPGHTYTKDPIVTVTADSEDCYVFVKVVDEIAGIQAHKVANGEDAAVSTIAEQMEANGWRPLEGVDNVYYQEHDLNDEDVEYPVFSYFTIKTDADVAGYSNAKIEITAYAIQADGFDTAKEAWTAGNF